MINLIPIEKKKKNVVNFYYRFTAVVFFMLGISALVATFALLPSYVLSSMKKNIVNQKLEIQALEPIPKLNEQTVTTLNSLNSQLDLIEKIKDNKYVVSQKAIEEIISRKISGIKITSIFYENSPVNGKKISINGIASSRERLLLFRQAFEDYSVFKKVDLPISNFVKGSNIKFNLNLIPS
jgi:Tfp pilus assembly protein PilN